MTLQEYFSSHQGCGILSTADSSGAVNSAIYARPKILDDGTLVLIMRERLTYENICVNPHAAYLFMENGPGYNGVRLYLKKIGEINDPKLAQEMTRCTLTKEEDLSKGPKHLLRFKVEKCLNLIGSQPRTFDPQQP